MSQLHKVLVTELKTIFKVNFKKIYFRLIFCLEYNRDQL